MSQLVTIVNTTRNTLIAENGEVARSFFARGMGLMGRNELPRGAALVIYPESSIHMLFMRFPIDVLFVDGEHQIVALHESLPPWRLFAGVAPWRGRYVVELPAGAIRASETAPGDRLAITPPLF